MGRMAEVLSELESIGAVGEKVVLFRREPLKVAPLELRTVGEGQNVEEQLAAQGELFEAERQQWGELVEVAGERLEVLARQVQELREFFQQLKEAVRPAESPHEEVQEES